MNDKNEKVFKDVSQPVPEVDKPFQQLIQKSTKMPSEMPDSLKNPPSPEDLINEE